MRVRKKKPTQDRLTPRMFLYILSCYIMKDKCLDSYACPKEKECLRASSKGKNKYYERTILNTKDFVCPYFVPKKPNKVIT